MQNRTLPMWLYRESLICIYLVKHEIRIKYIYMNLYCCCEHLTICYQEIDLGLLLAPAMFLQESLGERHIRG